MKIVGNLSVTAIKDTRHYHHTLLHNQTRIQYYAYITLGTITYSTSTTTVNI